MSVRFTSPPALIRVTLSTGIPRMKLVFFFHPNSLYERRERSSWYPPNAMAAFWPPAPWKLLAEKKPASSEE